MKHIERIHNDKYHWSNSFVICASTYVVVVVVNLECRDINETPLTKLVGQCCKCGGRNACTEGITHTQMQEHSQPSNNNKKQRAMTTEINADADWDGCEYRTRWKTITGEIKTTHQKYMFTLNFDTKQTIYRNETKQLILFLKHRTATQHTAAEKGCRWYLTERCN